MQRIEAAPGVDAHYFWGYRWSRRMRARPVPGTGSLKNAVKRLLPRAYDVERAVRQAAFSLGVRRRNIGLFHAPSFIPLAFSGPTVITVHDLSFLRYPETHPADRVAMLEKRLPRALREAACVLVDSDFVRGELLGQYSLPPEKVVTTHLGVSPRFRPMSKEEAGPALARLGLEYGRYILSVGTLEPRKNLAGTLEAYSMLPAATRAVHPLVLAGVIGWRMEKLEGRIAAMARSGKVRALGFVPEPDLPALYAGAALLAYPSLYEGFGLPVLEAMASGVPVVTSNCSSLPEVAGDAARMIEPGDRAALSEALVAMLEPSPDRQERVARGIKWARTFTWERCADQTIAVYRRAVLA